MTDKYHDQILTLISEKGPTGVNQLAKALEIPVSTMQRYLHKQTFFRMNEDKKWDLPEKVIGDVKSTSLTLVTDVIETSIMLLKSQIAELEHSVDNVLSPLNTLKRGIKGFAPAAGAVAGSSSKSDITNKHILDLDNDAQNLIKATKKYVQVCPQEYQELLINTDWYHLVTDLGYKYVKEYISPELGDLFLEQRDNLSEDTLEVIKEYQKGD